METIKPEIGAGLSTAPLSSKNVTRRELISSQHSDDSLNPCFSAVHELPEVGNKQVAFFLDDGLLM